METITRRQTANRVQPWEIVWQDARMALFAIGYDTNRIEVRENGLPCEVFMRSGANREIELYPIDEQESGLTIDDFLPGDTVMHDARHVAFIEVTGCLIAVPIP